MKKKKLFTIIIIVLLILIGVLAFIFFKTDYLKTNQQIFWKYAVENKEITKVFNNENISEVKNQKTSNSYTINSDLTVKTKSNNYKVTTITNAKNSGDTLTTVNFTKDDIDVIDFNLVKQSNLVGFKMDELANGYITLKNSNLKELAKNVGIEDTDKLPDNINWSTYIDILEISDEDVDYISNKYVSLIAHSTESKNYKEEQSSVKIDNEDHTATGYILTLTENESKKILSEVFYALSEDSRTLNLLSSKMKLLNLGEEYTKINNISNKCIEIAKKIEKLETSDEEFLEITVFVKDNKLIQTNIKIKDEKIIKIIFDTEKSKISIKQELLDEGKNTTRFAITISAILNNILNQVQEINIINTVSDDKKKMDTNFEIICNDEVTIIYNSTTQISETVQENADYENSTKIVLNDLSETQLKNLYEAIKKLLPKIYEEKKALLTGNNAENQEIVNNDVNNQNSNIESNVTE